jgi:hypothetical protein
VQSHWEFWCDFWEDANMWICAIVSLDFEMTKADPLLLLVTNWFLIDPGVQLYHFVQVTWVFLTDLGVQKCWFMATMDLQLPSDSFITIIANMINSYRGDFGEGDE